ncbi:Sec-independent protein translocase subunit TatA [Pengzhenrongella sicca]|uniref:Sec-independent protein translocase protein TatA n=1 Tax=Pengzhenrongella sicca TaxID=2819238 RepID=A0A8A4Z8P1_9MICO|nr:Sec-independent protein translocase subunit TatA [Pengzhenrongella sicca]QTE27835.1 Sec-independent protein translocase subunit TatA [Pengzhenrongella sicca]
MPNLKPGEIALILLIVLLLFGAKRLPDLARSVGKSLKILKTEVKDLGDDDAPVAPSAPANAAPPVATTPVAPVVPTVVAPPVVTPPVVIPEPYSSAPASRTPSGDDADRKQV